MKQKLYREWNGQWDQKPPLNPLTKETIELHVNEVLQRADLQDYKKCFSCFSQLNDYRVEKDELYIINAKTSDDISLILKTYSYVNLKHLLIFECNSCNYETAIYKIPQLYNAIVDKLTYEFKKVQVLKLTNRDKYSNYNSHHSHSTQKARKLFNLTIGIPIQYGEYTLTSKGYSYILPSTRLCYGCWYKSGKSEITEAESSIPGSDMPFHADCYSCGATEEIFNDETDEYEEFICDHYERELTEDTSFLVWSNHIINCPCNFGWKWDVFNKRTEKAKKKILKYFVKNILPTIKEDEYSTEKYRWDEELKEQYESYFGKLEKSKDSNLEMWSDA